MKKVSTTAAKQNRNLSRAKLTIGLDLGDRSSPSSKRKDNIQNAEFR